MINFQFVLRITGWRKKAMNNLVMSWHSEGGHLVCRWHESAQEGATWPRPRTNDSSIIAEVVRVAGGCHATGKSRGIVGACCFGHLGRSSYRSIWCPACRNDGGSTAGDWNLCAIPRKRVWTVRVYSTLHPGWLRSRGVTVTPVAIIRALPAPIRFSGLSFAYNIANAVFGGITPLFVSWLAHLNRINSAHYVAFATAIGLLGTLLLPTAESSSPAADFDST
jgi:hypothetical protein